MNQRRVVVFIGIVVFGWIVTALCLVGLWTGRIELIATAFIMASAALLVVTVFSVADKGRQARQIAHTAMRAARRCTSVQSTALLRMMTLPHLRCLRLQELGTKIAQQTGATQPLAESALRAAASEEFQRRRDKLRQLPGYAGLPTLAEMIARRAAQAHATQRQSRDQKTEGAHRISSRHSATPTNH